MADRDLVLTLKASLDKSIGFCNQFIEVCPDNVWTYSIGGYPAWQQIYHVFGSMDFFINGVNDKFTEGPADPVIGRLEVKGTEAVSKAEMAKFAKTISEKVNNYLSGLSDADLSKKHEGFSSRLKFDCNILGVLSMLNGHVFYHFGQCDAALRDNNLKGLF